eukprot:TRINITY_DN41210_c0_g1_i4.p1 TRINITY_DN41210_c0_g1~~TRINITY_DN41210_c0_g1_i4.p1  ORF type:complete len:455 (+),score=60.70 TRINITY_DN41210_c0_g1_i4:156-1367(+)
MALRCTAAAAATPPPQLATSPRRLRLRLRSLSWRRTLAPVHDHLLLASTLRHSSQGRHWLPPAVTCNAQTVVATNMALGTPVRPTSILVVGATGTLGRQVVRRALDEGYDVRCLVRPRPAPADFLRDWGATVVNADLSKPETIPATLVGIHTVIDCATGRPEEPIRTVDWEGKVALIQCAMAMGIQKYVFYSIHNCDKHPEVPLMEIKHCTEKFLQDSGLTYIIIRLCGFMQGLIGQYAVPILEEKSVWGTDAPTRIAYMDTQDIARLTFIALRNEKINKKLLTFAGPRAWTTQEVITLCERLAGQDANVTTVPVSILKFTRQLTRFFQWTNDVADRLAFSEVTISYFFNYCLSMSFAVTSVTESIRHMVARCSHILLIWPSHGQKEPSHSPLFLHFIAKDDL